MLFRTQKNKVFFCPPYRLTRGDMVVGGSTNAGEEVVAESHEGFYRILFVLTGEWH
jgi:hypothetical protein